MTARISIDGNLADDPQYGVSPAGVSWANLRVASHERVRRDGEWISTDPQYFAVSVFNTAAEQAVNSLKKGDPVHLEGRVELEQFTRRDGSPGAGIKVYATHLEARETAPAQSASTDRAVQAEPAPAGRPTTTADVAIIHRGSEGVAVTGVGRDNADAHDALKQSGFRWSATNSRWVLPKAMEAHDRDLATDDLASRFTAVGQSFGTTGELAPTRADSPAPATDVGRDVGGRSL